LTPINCFFHESARPFFFEFFEELARDPQDLLFRMFKFLGAESSKQHMAHIADRPVNAK
jgi:hypothetical protein